MFHCLYVKYKIPHTDFWAFQVAQWVKNLPAMQEM